MTVGSVYLLRHRFRRQRTVNTGGPMMLRMFVESSLLLVLVITCSQCGTSFAQLTTYNPYIPTYTDCCELKLMDSNLQVAIESSRSLPVGRFVSLKARFCTTDAVYIQIWKQINETAYEFKWQTQYTATQADTVRAYTVVRFDNNPVSIEATDRIGVYSPSTNASLKIAIPYNFDTPPANAMYFSRQRFDAASAFTTGLTIYMEDLRWPRTLATFLSFCQSVSDCQELTSDNLVSTANPFSGYIPKSCCNKNMVSCDVGNTVKDGLNDQNNQVKNLQDTINTLQITLTNLLNSQYVTGTCPDGFAPGTYGVGSCYIAHRELLQMAEAVIRCRDLYSARLLNIQSQQEDNFVKGFLMNSSTSAVERFWTSGMYNFELRNWFWYDDDLVTKLPFGSYRNWKDGIELAANSVYDVCSVFTVNQTQNSDYWEKTICTNLNYFVCEIPKTCF